MKENQLRNMLDNIELSEQDKQRILKSCLAGKRVSNKVLRYSKQLAAALLVGIVCTGSLTVYAAVSAYQAYMEKMSRQEVQERFDNVQSSVREADSFSRPLSEQERTVLERMQVAYQEGVRFPEQSMKCFDGRTNDYKPKKDILSYDHVNGIFYLPERELTEEDCLQIIDVWEKAEYSLVTIHDERSEDEITLEEAVEIMEQNKHEITESLADGLEGVSDRIVEDITGKYMEDTKWEVVLYGENNQQYIATLETAEGTYSIFYLPDSTPMDWVVKRYAYHSETAEELSEIDYTEKQITEKAICCGEKAVWQLKNCFGIKEKIEKCEYGYNREAQGGDWLYILITVANEDRYEMRYRMETEQLTELITYKAELFEEFELLEAYEISGVLE